MALFPCGWYGMSAKYPKEVFGMSSIGNTGKKIADWLSAGTTTQVWIKKALVVLVGVLILYRLGYVVGKLLFHCFG